MAGRIERALEAGLRIRPGEQRRVALMALYAANAIGAVVVGRSVRDALYLSNRPARGLAGMYIWSSIAIVLVSWLYARIADRMRRGLLNALSALGCAALGAAFWAVLTVTDAVWVYAGLYVFVEAMGSLVVIQFWTLANDVFHAREAKRLFGLIGGGGTLANVIFGLLVGRYAQVFGAQNLLLLMVAQLVLCAVLAQAGSRLASVDRSCELNSTILVSGAASFRSGAMSRPRVSPSRKWSRMTTSGRVSRAMSTASSAVEASPMTSSFGSLRRAKRIRSRMSSSSSTTIKTLTSSPRRAGVTAAPPRTVAP